MRDVYEVLRHVGIFLSDNSDEGSVSPNSCPSVSRPSALSSGFSHFQGQGRREENQIWRNGLGSCSSLWANQTMSWGDCSSSLVGRIRAEFYHHPLEGIGRSQEAIWNKHFRDRNCNKEMTLITSLSPKVYGPLHNHCFGKPLPLFAHSPCPCCRAGCQAFPSQEARVSPCGDL